MGRYSTRKYTAQDLEELMENGRKLYAPKPELADLEADWLLGGGLGSTVWQTKNSGKEYFDDGEWKNTINIWFDRALPDGSILTDPKNRLVLETLQRWAFANRCGYLDHAQGPVSWRQATRWGLNFTSWVYLNKDELHPTKYGFNLVNSDDIRGLLSDLSMDSWCKALRLEERIYIELYHLSYGTLPSQEKIDHLPMVDETTKTHMIQTLIKKDAYITKNKKKEQFISRVFLEKLVKHTTEGFRSKKLRKFLRQFEEKLSQSPILVQSQTLTKYPSQRLPLIDSVDSATVTEKSYESHIQSCEVFFAGSQITELLIPTLDKSVRSLGEQSKQNTSQSQHQSLIPLDEGLLILNNAAKWIVQYSDQLLELYSKYLKYINSPELSNLSYKEYTKKKKAYYAFILKETDKNNRTQPNSPNLVKDLGLDLIFVRGNRAMEAGNLTFSQAIFILIGACTYAIGMMKPMREGEMEMIPYNCILKSKQSNGCWMKLSAEKTGVLGYQESITRPIPFLTYRAASVLQKIGHLTEECFNGDRSSPPRLFYFPSRDGFGPPKNQAVSIAITRCMDFFVDHLSLPPDDYGRRRYYRTHELRKFFLLMLSWDEKLHGWECGAWMAAHRDAKQMQAYTEANLNGEEITAWEAEYIELKLLQLEGCNSSEREPNSVMALYQMVLNHFKAKSLSSLNRADFDSYIKNAIDSKKFQIQPIHIANIDPEVPDPVQLVVVLNKA